MKEKDDALLVEVFTGSRWEAEVTKGLLESNGIKVALKDGIMGTIAPYISPEVAVMVNENDYEIANEIINSRRKNREREKEKEGEVDLFIE